LEEVDFPEPIGRLEAFTTGGGTDTMPWTYQGKLRTLENKTLRYPGHYAQLRAFYDLGLWSLEPIQVPGDIADIAGSGGVHDPGTALDGAGSGRVHDPADPTQQAGSPPGTVEVVPRDLFHALFEPKVTFPEDKDLIVVRVKAVGKKDGRDAEAVVELIDYYDEATGFTAMERCTGWSAAIVAEMMVRGDTPRGAGGVEIMVPARAYVHELARRGIGVREQITS
jgi:lysine 6-dehydrogenase